MEWRGSPATKSATGSRDPEMRQSQKGKQWYFGMKAHIGVDADSALVHTVRGTAGHVNDVVEANTLLHTVRKPKLGVMPATRARPSARMPRAMCAGTSPCARASASCWTRAGWLTR